MTLCRMTHSLATLFIRIFFGLLCLALKIFVVESEYAHGLFLWFISQSVYCIWDMRSVWATALRLHYESNDDDNIFKKRGKSLDSFCFLLLFATSSLFYARNIRTRLRCQTIYVSLFKPFSFGYFHLLKIITFNSEQQCLSIQRIGYDGMMSLTHLLTKCSNVVI